MPQNKRESLIFTVMMCFFMVFLYKNAYLTNQKEVVHQKDFGHRFENHC